MKKILYGLQLSAVDKTGKFLLDKDSNFNFCKSMIKTFEKYYKGKYHHYVILPEYGCLFSDIESNNIDCVYHLDYYTNKVFSSRYHWNSNVARTILNKVKPDIIWENNPTLVNNWKTLLLEEGLIDKVKIVSYNHWPHNTEYPKIDRRCSYLYRQVEAIHLSDITLCNTDFVKQQLIDSINELENINLEITGCSYIQSIAPIIDCEKIEKYNCKKREDIIKIIYPHRLSSISYYKDAFDNFIYALNKLKERKLNKKVEVILTDASGKIKDRKDIKFKDSKNIKLILKNNMNREQYYKELNDSHICVASFRQGNGGGFSMSLLEAIFANNACLIPSHSGYRYMAPDKFNGWIFDICTQLQLLINDNDIYNKNVKDLKEYYKDYNIKIIKKLDKIFNSI
jgi:hypothetical protein